MMKIKKQKQSDQSEVRNSRSVNPGKAPVFSYHSSRFPDQARNLRGSRNDYSELPSTRSSWLVYLPSIGAVMAVLLAFGYTTTLTTSPRVTISSNPKRLAVLQSTDVYEAAAARQMTSSVFNRSKLLINTNAIANHLETDFPELGNVVVTIPLIGRKPVIKAQPAIPSLILSGKNGTYVIDTEGVPILKSTKLASSVRDSLPVVTDGSDTNIELGKQVITKDLTVFVTSIQAYLNQQNINVDSYRFPAVANEIHISITGKGYYVKFNTETDVKTQVGTYLALEELLQQENKTPAEYIDVRVEEKAFYR